MKAVEDVCGLYGVPATRMQSRMFTVPGVGGRERPFYVGEWTDERGEKHQGGMADFLLQPSINLEIVTGNKALKGEHVTVPLWVECKAGSGELQANQKAFKAWVEWTGAGYLCVTDNCQTLMDWFEIYGVEKR
jgi:hypothetical protein